MMTDEQLAEWERTLPDLEHWGRLGDVTMALIAEVRRLRAENEGLRACMVPVIRPIETPPLTEEESKRLARDIAEGMTNCPPFLLPAGCCCGMAPSGVTLTISDGTDDGPAMVGRVAERIEREGAEAAVLTPHRTVGDVDWTARPGFLGVDQAVAGTDRTAVHLGDAVGQAYAHAMAVQPPSGFGDAVAYGRTNPVPPECVEPAADTPVVVEGPK